MIDQTSGFLDQLSDEQISAAASAIEQHGFPKEVQGVDVDGVLQHLKLSRDVLNAAVKSGYLQTQPAQMHRELISILQNLTQSIAAAINGQNSVPGLVTQGDQLRVYITRNRLDTGDGDVRAFAARANELAELLKEATKLARTLRAAVKRTSELEDLLKRSNDALAQTHQHQQQAETHSKGAAEQLQAAAAAATQAREALTVAGQHRDAAGAAEAAAEEKRAAVLAYEKDLKTLYDQGAEFRKTIEEVQQGAESDREQNRSQVDEIINRLQGQQDAIERALAHATGVSLFCAFDNRQQRLGKTKWIWLALLIGALGSFALVVQWIVAAAVESSTSFWVRLAVAPVFFYAIGFLTKQYGHDRHLEEIYAFKSKISLSLEAYRDLVRNVLSVMENLPEGDPRAQYAEFIIASVNRVFTPPPDHVEVDVKKGRQPDAAQDILEKVVKGVVEGLMKPG